MASFVRYLMSLLLHIIWHQTGNRGAVPPVRLPRSKTPVEWPAIGGWQLIIAIWILKKIWSTHGDSVTRKASRHGKQVADRAGAYFMPLIASIGAERRRRKAADSPPPPSLPEPSGA